MGENIAEVSDNVRNSSNSLANTIAHFQNFLLDYQWAIAVWAEGRHPSQIIEEGCAPDEYGIFLLHPEQMTTFERECHDVH